MENFSSFGIACVLLLILASLSGCAFYNKEFKVKQTDTDQYELKVVQVDDFGSFWDSDGANQTLKYIEEESKKTNVSVVVFIHGWHHNAQECDDNLRDFQNLVLVPLAKNLHTKDRTDFRIQFTHDPNVKLIGIYIGWRGKSLPLPLDYLTMWGRKDTAERVGEGDVSEFLERLQRMYLRANAIKSDSIYKPYMGLVTMGHSFGGQVLLKAISKQMEFELAERACEMSDSTKPQIVKKFVTERVPIDGFGDLNILLNPATEAYQFARIDNLYRQLTYPKSQTPQLVVFSAENDTARKVYFPLARMVTWPFRPGFKNDIQGDLWGTSLGVYPAQITHSLTREDDEDYSLKESDYQNGGTKIADYDFTSITRFNHVKLSPKNDVSQADWIRYSPIAVVQAVPKLIDNHDGIFKQEFQNDFLSSYIAFVQGKRILVRYERMLESKEHRAPSTTGTSCPELAEAGKTH